MKRSPRVPLNPFSGILVIGGLFVVAYLLQPLIVALAVFAVAYVGVKVFKKIRRTRRRAEAWAKASTSEAVLDATPPSKHKSSQTALHGELQGLHDAKRAKALGALSVTFNVNGEMAPDWYAGYCRGVHRILPDAAVNRNYAPQGGGSFIA